MGVVQDLDNVRLFYVIQHKIEESSFKRVLNPIWTVVDFYENIKILI